MANLDEETLRAKFEEAQQVISVPFNFQYFLFTFLLIFYIFRLLNLKVHMKIFLIWLPNMQVNKQRKDKRLQIREQQQGMQVPVEVQEPRNIRNSSFRNINLKPISFL